MQSSDENERYQRYLCSPEWGQRRRIVMARCGEWCERCHNARMTHVHHLTYIRKYNELPEDLQGVCAPCHDFIHGRSPADPLATAPVRLAGRPIGSVYLAGKVSGTKWRQGIVDHDDRCPDRNNLYIDFNQDEDDWFAAKAVPVPGDARRLDYVGPFKMDRSGTGGHGVAPDAGGGAHAYGTPIRHGDGGDEADVYATDCGEVVGKCLGGVESADLVFAWIDNNDCYGTICEISYAYSLSRMRMGGLGSTRVSTVCSGGTIYRLPCPLIVVAFGDRRLRDEQWFHASMADIFICRKSVKSPRDAWDCLWGEFRGIVPLEARVKQVTREEVEVYYR